MSQPHLSGGAADRDETKPSRSNVLAREAGESRATAQTRVIPEHGTLRARTQRARAQVTDVAGGLGAVVELAL